MIFAFCSLGLECLFLLVYSGKVTTGKGGQHGKFVLTEIMFQINKSRVGMLWCPRGVQTAWADDNAVCPPYDFIENKFILLRVMVTGIISDFNCA